MPKLWVPGLYGWLIGALVMSSAAWLFQIAVDRIAALLVEGIFYAVLQVWALSFYLTGPLVIIGLRSFIHDKSLAFWKIAVIYFCISLPMLAFGVIVLLAIVPSVGMFGAAVLAVAIYGAYFAVLCAVVRKFTGPRALKP